jgi:hypothetical protein
MSKQNSLEINVGANSPPFATTDKWRRSRRIDPFAESIDRSSIDVGGVIALRPFMALSRHANSFVVCPLSGVKQRSQIMGVTSAFDPKRTSTRGYRTKTLRHCFILDLLQ